MSVVTLNGFDIKEAPRNQKLFSYPVLVLIPAGVTRTIQTESEFNGVARSVQLVNQDGTNNGLARINGITTPQFNVPPGGAIGFTDQWVNQIQIVAGALGALLVMMEMVPVSEVEVL